MKKIQTFGKIARSVTPGNFFRHCFEQEKIENEAQKIKRQKCTKKKVSGFTRDAVAAILAIPDVSTRTGKGDKNMCRSST